VNLSKGWHSRAFWAPPLSVRLPPCIEETLRRSAPQSDVLTNGHAWTLHPQRHPERAQRAKDLFGSDDNDSDGQLPPTTASATLRRDFSVVRSLKMTSSLAGWPPRTPRSHSEADSVGRRISPHEADTFPPGTTTLESQRTVHRRALRAPMLPQRNTTSIGPSYASKSLSLV